MVGVLFFERRQTKAELTATPKLSWAKLQKSRQKCDSKTREIDWSNLRLQQFDKNFNIVCMQWPETEVIRKTREITSSELIFGGF